MREQGKTYKGWSGKKPGKKGRGTERQEIKMGPPCSSKACINSTVRHCNEITETERKELFNIFCTKLLWDQKKCTSLHLYKKKIQS